jgi:hypothetical protein
VSSSPPWQLKYPPKKHSVLLVGDSHIRGPAERLAMKLRSFFCTIDYVKPNANLNNITSPMKSEIRNLSKSDVVELFGCTQDVARNNTGCPTRYRTRHFFNNFTTNEDIATKFEVDLPHCVRNVKEKNILLFKFLCNILIGVRVE